MRGTSSPSETATQAPPPTEIVTPSSTPEPGVLFYDDFVDGLDPAWQVTGDWMTNRGRAMVQSGCGTLVIGEPDWNHHVIETNFMVDTVFEVVFIVSYQDENNYTRLRADRSGNLNWQVVKDGGHVQVPDSTISGYSPRQSHNLAIEIEGNAIRGTIDEEPVYDFTFDRPMSGPVGISTCASASNPPTFEDFKVSVLAP